MKKMLLMALLALLLIASAAYAAPSGLIGAWVLTPEYMNGIALSALYGKNGTINGPQHFVDGLYGKAMVFDGISNRIELYKGAPSGTTLPAKKLAIEAWAKIKTRVYWTGILNYVQDNGSYERGFFLGVVDGRIGGYIATIRNGDRPDTTGYPGITISSLSGGTT